MVQKIHLLPFIAQITAAILLISGASLYASSPVHTANGLLSGTESADAKVRIFKGIPFAAAPVNDLRWKTPQLPSNWSGVRQATEFGPRCMQANIYHDMVFRDKGPSEDCLYLNVWTPAASSAAKLPVMVWIHGGGFAAGSSSEPRQDGEHLAGKGVVVVSMNYRLGVFGFFSLPELAKESGRNSAGNYGLLDQVAALQWVQKNIEAFGGNKENVTIFGESAGSFSVSALMASPLASGLFERAIGESGAYFGATLPTRSLAASEAADSKFAAEIKANSLADLRSMPAAQLLQAAQNQGEVRFAPNVDGYFLPQDVYSIYAAGKQLHIPLLAGWNADEGSYHSIFRKEQPTLKNYLARLQALFGEKSGEVLKMYPASDDAQVKRSAQDLASDQFIAYSTWKWIEMQSATGASPVYRYHFEDAPPAAQDDTEAASRGAYHSAEIEFVFEDLASKHLPWRKSDKRLSDIISTYWSNFAKTGDPNSDGLPKWPTYQKDDGYQVMHLGAEPHAAPDQLRPRYELLDSMTAFQPTSK